MQQRFDDVTSARRGSPVAQPIDPPQLAIAIDDPGRLRTAGAAPVLADGVIAGEARATHLYFGSEFCEHLFPSRAAILRAAEVAAQRGMTLVLTTPAANDALVARIEAAASALPRDAEVVVNDWGVARRLRAAQPERSLIAGRQLLKMIKDPRLPSPAWLTPFASGYAGAPFRRILQRLRFTRVELDVPPFATANVFDIDGFAVSAWVPYGYVAKGRICKVGSMHRERPTKFSPGGACRRECRRVIEVDADPAQRAAASLTRVGGTLLYRHGAPQAALVRAGIAAGRIDRLVVCDA